MAPGFWHIAGGETIALDAQCREHADPKHFGVAGCLQRSTDVERAGPLGEHDAVGHTAGDGQRLRAAHAGQHGWHDGGRIGQLHIGEPHLPPGEGDLLAAQQAPNDGDHLFEGGERAGRARADLLHPALHPVPDAGDQAAGCQTGQGGQLHRGDGRVASHCRQDAQTHLEPLGAGEGGGGQRDAGSEEAVLDHPQLVHPARLQPFGELDDGGGWEGAIEAHAKRWSGHRGTVTGRADEPNVLEVIRTR